ncbi:hypothetical protein N7510_006063 [Penicillium lagena]|uniref:uncharacterized protein n=1 Tax=Penicillium lagena TaxID=94218 RepID=UPI002542131A|nr:uncharacterized protein N7510_006063 [Penicillium lagena]KAJ5612869.1 hypothetical protein N7510_006063 [Penicillium lagena]
MGPDQHPQLDSFGLVLPFPLRLAIILVAGFWGWAINLHYLAAANIDVPSLIRYPARSSSSQPPHHTSAYRLATALSIPVGIWIVVFWFATRRSVELVERLDFIPQSCYIVLLLILIWPFNRLARSGRIHFLRTLKRVSIGGLAESKDGKFGDILLADALTSYARVLGDLYASFCMFFMPDISSTEKPVRSCGRSFIVPLIVAIPSLIRLRQCLIEYVRARRTNLRRDENRANGHLLNALKYSTAFPVIWLSTKVRNYSPLDFFGFSEMSLMRFLFIFCFINSAYSFYWDVVRDWDLTLLTPHRHNKEHPYGLRRHRYFSDRLYHYVIFADLALRFSWLWRALPGLAWLSETESGYFTLMFLEVARRWMWVFFRTEAEWIRNSHGPGPDDVLLGEYNYKFDAD